jgi:YD repeat-containing protein
MRKLSFDQPLALSSLPGLFSGLLLMLALLSLSAQAQSRNSSATDGTTVLRRVENSWRQKALVSWWNASATLHGEAGTGEPANDPRAVETVTTLENNQVTKRTSIDPRDATGQTVGFDQYNNQTDVWEYDYGAGAPGSLLRHTHTDYLSTNTVNGADYASPAPNASSIHLRNLPQQQSVYDAQEVERESAAYEYDQYTSDANHAVLADCPNISGLDAAFTTAYNTRGNVTSITRYLLDNGTATGSISAYSQYDIAGNVVKVKDARGNATLFDYTDRFGTPDGEARSNSAPTELGGQSGYGFATGVSNALGQAAFTQFDYYLGKPVNSEDVNGAVSSGSYDDLLDRPSQIIRDVNNLAAKGQTSFSYDAASRLITMTGDLNSYGDNSLKSETLYDGLGRTTETHHYETSTSYIISLQVTGDGQANQTYSFPDYEYDVAGNLKSETYPSGRMVAQGYDGAGRLNSVSGQQSGEQGKTYADSLTYWPGGAVKDLRLGNGLSEHTQLNSRLQPTEIDLGIQQGAVDRLKLAYSYETSAAGQSNHDNNGNVLSQTITVPQVGTAQGFTASQTFMQGNTFKLFFLEPITHEQFVNALFNYAGLYSFRTEREQETTALQNGLKTRAQVFRDVIELEASRAGDYNSVSVYMQYFGYLAREPDFGGYNFWLNILTHQVPNNYQAMVCAFITSAEYQKRFSPILTHNNTECVP